MKWWVYEPFTWKFYTQDWAIAKMLLATPGVEKSCRYRNSKGNDYAWDFIIRGAGLKHRVSEMVEKFKPTSTEE